MLHLDHLSASLALVRTGHNADSDSNAIFVQLPAKIHLPVLEADYEGTD